MKKPLFESKSGIYVIQCKQNLKIYIGSSRNLTNRFYTHKSKLKNNKHYNKYLQNAWNKYGAQNFMFGVLEYCPIEDLLNREQKYLDEYLPYEDELGYNDSKVSSVGTKELSEIQRKKLSDENVNRYGVEFEIMSPDGRIFKAKGISKFARENGLAYPHLIEVLKGRSLYAKGWRLPTTPPRDVRVVRDPSGQLHSIEHRKMSGFSRQHNLGEDRLGFLLKGKIRSYKGWTLPDTVLKIETYTAIDPYGEKHIIPLGTVIKFSEKHQLEHKAMLLMLKGRRSEYKGWTRGT